VRAVMDGGAVAAALPSAQADAAGAGPPPGAAAEGAAAAGGRAAKLAWLEERLVVRRPVSGGLAAPRAAARAHRALASGNLQRRPHARHGFRHPLSGVPGRAAGARRREALSLCASLGMAQAGQNGAYERIVAM